MSPDVRRRPARLSVRARRLTPSLLACLAAACGGASTAHIAAPSVSPTVASTVVASPTPSDSAAAAQASLIAAYKGTYYDVEAAVKAGNAMSPLLARHSIPPAEYQLQTDVGQYLKLGVVPSGVPQLHAEVASLDLSSSPEQATLTSCPAALKLLDLKTGKAVTSRSLPPNPFTVTLQTRQGHWVVSYFKVDRSKTCSA
jgi:hypothetical protein